MNLGALLGVLLAVVVPIGLLVATLHYGSAAFQELWLLAVWASVALGLYLAIRPGTTAPRRAGPH